MNATNYNIIFYFPFSLEFTAGFLLIQLAWQPKCIECLKLITILKDKLKIIPQIIL